MAKNDFQLPYFCKCPHCFCLSVLTIYLGQFGLPSEQPYTVLELPYLDRSLRLLVALPSDRKTPLSHLESQLTARAVGLWETGLRRTKMDIFLPR